MHITEVLLSKVFSFSHFHITSNDLAKFRNIDTMFYSGLVRYLSVILPDKNHKGLLDWSMLTYKNNVVMGISNFRSSMKFFDVSDVLSAWKNCKMLGCVLIAPSCAVLPAFRYNTIKFPT